MTCDGLVTYIVFVESELVFKALGDANRRRILDLLQARDGRSLTEIEGQFAMTRFGVMKHLRILQNARLITTRRSGRETLHFLNAVPIQQVYDRWVNKYSARWASSLTELKYELEANVMIESKKTEHVFVVYIKTDVAKLWRALTDGELTSKYYFGSFVESDWNAGSPCRYLGSDGHALIEGTVIECEPPKRLVMTFNPKWGDGGSDFPESRVTFEIGQSGEVCKLTVVHSELSPGNSLTSDIFDGWSRILSGLKTLLETGSPLAAVDNM